MKIPWGKIKDALLVVILSIFCPMFLQLFKFNIQDNHIIWCGILGIAVAIYILLNKSAEPEEKIEKRRILYDVDDNFLDKVKSYLRLIKTLAAPPTISDNPTLSGAVSPWQY